VLFGSGPLLVRGWIEDVGDLDVLARGAAWAEAQRRGPIEHLEEWDVEVVAIGNITIGTQWAIGDIDVDRLIDDAELIEGIPCARLDDVVAYKLISDREKDRLHLTIIESHGYKPGS
jgi:hypothetical protein